MMPLETILVCRNCFDKSHSIEISISKLESGIETRKWYRNSKVVSKLKSSIETQKCIETQKFIKSQTLGIIEKLSWYFCHS